MSALSTLNLPWYEEIGGALWNASTGTLSDSQKAALEAQQTQNEITAGADPTTAATQAASDVTAALKLNNADPSQASLFNNPGLSSLFSKLSTVIVIAAIAAIAYFAFEAYRIFHHAQ